MKKVLVYLYEGSLQNCGGPRGYNCALKSQLDMIEGHNVEFLPGGSIPTSSFWDKRKNLWYGKIVIRIKNLLRLIKQFYIVNKKAVVDLEQYDIVHFHNTISMFLVQDSLKSYHGKVILTSHCPIVPYKEFLDSLSNWEQKHLGWYYKRMEQIDRYAFNRADYIIFPCQEAEEPYYHSWPYFTEIKKRKSSCFKYLFTGTYQCVAKKSRKEVCQSLGIPEDSFILCYAGRHNEVKGFHYLKIIGENLLKQHNNVYFIIAGKEGPIKGLTHPRWIEIGWTDDPHSYISASDVFLLPNKETYFDLILLEVISLGKIVIASNTGGNKIFGGKTKGVITYNTLEEAIDYCNNLMEIDESGRKELEKDNLDIFNKEFTLRTFAEKYLQLLEKL